MLHKLSPLILLVAVILLSETKHMTQADSPNSLLKISDKGIELIKKFEGYRDKAYLCAGGQWTIGWGSTIVKGTRVQQGDSVTAPIALDALKTHLDTRTCPSIIKHVKSPLSQLQFDALCSFIYNTGEGGLRYYSSTSKTFKDTQVKQKLNAQDYKGAADALLSWDKVSQNGKMVPLAGLTTRRKEERTLFLEGTV